MDVHNNKDDSSAICRLLGDDMINFWQLTQISVNGARGISLCALIHWNHRPINTLI